MSRNPIARALADARNRRRILPDKRLGIDQRETEKRLRQMQRDLNEPETIKEKP